MRGVLLYVFHVPASALLTCALFCLSACVQAFEESKASAAVEAENARLFKDLERLKASS